MRPRLRLFTGDDDSTSVLQEPQVPMKFGEFFQIVSEASRFKRTWVHDFEDDEVRIPADLYEVLTAYWTLRPGA